MAPSRYESTRIYECIWVQRKRERRRVYSRCVAARRRAFARVSIFGADGGTALSLTLWKKSSVSIRSPYVCGLFSMCGKFSMSFVYAMRKRLLILNC